MRPVNRGLAPHIAAEYHSGVYRGLLNMFKAFNSSYNSKVSGSNLSGSLPLIM